MLHYLTTYGSPASPMALLAAAALLTLAAPFYSSPVKFLRYASRGMLLVGILLAGQAAGYAVAYGLWGVLQWF